MKRIVPVIMSGGSGTRLWPLSRVAHPKQLHALVSEMTMVQETAQRVTGQAGDYTFAPPIIVLNERQHELARQQLEALGIEPSHYVIEPVGRNTAPVAAVASCIVKEAYGEDTLVLLLPADHHIRNVEGFRAAIEAGAGLADDGYIITFGVQPDRAETGYGYIRRGTPLAGGYTVGAFTEKPDLERAEGFLADGGYYWNAGIFLFGAGRLCAEMAEHCAGVLAASERAVGEAERAGGALLLDAGAFETCPSISFDYAVMENTARAAVVPADIGWSDVGAWSALWEISDKDTEGNAARGDVEIVDSRNTYVFSSGQKVGVVGVDDLVVVATADAVLVTRRDASQDVKKIVERLKAGGHHHLL